MGFYDTKGSDFAFFITGKSLSEIRASNLKPFLIPLFHFQLIFYLSDPQYAPIDSHMLPIQKI
jgi:hypothetical protein